MDDNNDEAERHALLAVEQDIQPSKAAMFLLNSIALFYGGVTGIVVMNGVVLTAPVPTETAEDTFFLLVGSAIASIGIINLNRQHIKHVAHEFVNSDSSFSRSLLRNICGHDQLPLGLSVFNTTLKIAGSAAESCIAYSVVRQVLNHAPSLTVPLGVLYAVSAFCGFPSVEGNALTKKLKGESIIVDSSGNKKILKIDEGIFKRIFFPELALIEAIHKHETDLIYAKRQSTGPELVLPSIKKLIAVNCITLLASFGMGALAFLDIRSLCTSSTYGYVIGIFVAVLYIIADIALRGNEAKRKLYQMPNEEQSSDIEAVKHAPFMTVFAVLQSLLLALIPFVVMLELLYFNDSHIHAQHAGICQLLIAAMFAIPKLITSFLVEGMGLINNFTHKDGGPLFSSLFNILQFAAPALCISLYEIWQHNYSPVSIVIAYSIAGGANLLLSTLRHYILRAVDKDFERTFYSNKAIAAWVLTNLLIPLSGGVFQALLQYLTLSSETKDKNKQEEWATLGGSIASGLSCVLTRLYANKTSMFYRKELVDQGGSGPTILPTTTYNTANL